MEDWVKLVKKEGPLVPYNLQHTCCSCDRIRYSDAAYWQCIGYMAFQFNVERWHAAIFGWNENAEVYHGTFAGG